MKHSKFILRTLPLPKHILFMAASITAFSFTSCYSNGVDKEIEIIEASKPRNNGISPEGSDTNNFTPGSRTIYAKNIAFKMVNVQGGSFIMGAGPEQCGEEWYNEKPLHKVTLSHFAIAETEVTQALWSAIMGDNPSYRRGDNLPVEQVSYQDCLEFIDELNKVTGYNFRLPTEAEWEYAARGGQKSKGYKYAGSNNLDEVAVYADNSHSNTQPVAGKKPNELGLYDMSGNVWEWCSDWYSEYAEDSQVDPLGPVSGTERCLRGGSWYSISRYCRVTNRYFNDPDVRYDYYRGLRLAYSL